MVCGANRVIRHLWRMNKMGHMDAATRDVMLSSLILSTTPSGTSGITILIIVPSCVSLPAGVSGECKRFSLLSPFRIRDANFTHAFFAAINNSTLRSTYKTISNTAGNWIPPKLFGPSDCIDTILILFPFHACQYCLVSCIEILCASPGCVRAWVSVGSVTKFR
jgi:hypothetical protein